MAKLQTTDSLTGNRIVSRDELSARLNDRTFVLVNVMPRETYGEEHIPRSINLPVAEIEEKARQCIADFSQEVVIYCAGPT